MANGSDDQGYRFVAKFLHWAMFLALGAQFLVGYSIERADDLLEVAVDRWLGGEDDNLILVHGAIGMGILLLAVVRLVWRKTMGLPPWAQGLSEFERKLAHRVEKALYWTMFLIPVTGLALVLVSGEDWDLAGREWDSPWELVPKSRLLAVHILTHVTFLVAFCVHVGLVLKHQLLDRDRLLNRMF